MAWSLATNIKGPPGPPGSSANAGAFIGPEPPPEPAVGALWWESDSGQMFIWYQDINSSQWVPTNAYTSDPTLLLARINDLEARLAALEGT